MTDRKMTKAEIAAQMGITEAELAKREGAKKAQIVDNFREEVRVTSTPVEAQPPWYSDFKGMLSGAFKNAKNAVSNTASAAVSMAADLMVDLTSASHRSGTTESNPNRLTADKLKATEQSASTPAPGGPK